VVAAARIQLIEVDRAIEREHLAAVAAGKPWPPERTPQPQSEPVREPEDIPGPDPEANGQSGPNDHTARLDELLAQATEAVGRFTKEKTDREGGAEYAARLEREAHAEPERALQTEASYEAEIELYSSRACHHDPGFPDSDLVKFIKIARLVGIIRPINVARERHLRDRKLNAAHRHPAGCTAVPQRGAWSIPGTQLPTQEGHYACAKATKGSRALVPSQLSPSVIDSASPAGAEFALPAE